MSNVGSWGSKLANCYDEMGVNEHVHLRKITLDSLSPSVIFEFICPLLCKCP